MDLEIPPAHGETSTTRWRRRRIENRDAVITNLKASRRQGKYTPDLRTELAGKSVEQLTTTGRSAWKDNSPQTHLVTTAPFGWFELQLDYNISEAGNSGIMYHITDQGGAAWATGPEFQLEDNVKAADEIRCGWLYGLYQPPDDPRTGKPLDAT